MTELNDIFNMKLGIQDEGLYINKEAVAHKMKMVLQKPEVDWRQQEDIRQESITQIFSKLNDYKKGDLINIEQNQILNNEGQLVSQKVK